MHNTYYPIAPSPNSHASLAANSNNQSEDSNITSDNISETNSFILSIEECINIIKDGI